MMMTTLLSAYRWVTKRLRRMTPAWVIRRSRRRATRTVPATKLVIAIPVLLSRWGCQSCHALPTYHHRLPATLRHVRISILATLDFRVFLTRPAASLSILPWWYMSSRLCERFIYEVQLLIFLVLGGLASEGWHKACTSPPQGNQEPVVVKTWTEDPGRLGVGKSLECDAFSLQCYDSVGWMSGRASNL